MLDVILPPGGYSIVVSGAGGATGIALIESFEQRTGSTRVLSLTGTSPATPVTNVAAAADTRRKGPPVVLEICGAPMTGTVTASR